MSDTPTTTHDAMRQVLIEAERLGVRVIEIDAEGGGTVRAVFRRDLLEIRAERDLLGLLRRLHIEPEAK